MEPTPQHPDFVARPHPSGLRQLLRVRGLRRLIATRFLTSAGDGIFLGALLGSVLFDPSQRGTPAAIAAGFAVLLLPYSIIGPFAGALLDRWSRRNVLLFASLVRAGIVAVLAFLMALGSPTWVLFGAALLVTGTGRFVGSGLSSGVPHLVAPESLIGANALSTTIGSVSSLVGGAGALGLRGLLGAGSGPTAVSCLVVAFLFLAAAAVVRGFPRWSLGPDHTDEPRQTLLAVLGGLADGVRHAIRRPSVGLSLALVVTVRMAVGWCTLVVLLLFQYYFTEGWGPIQVGLAGVTEVVAVAGIGIFLGAVSTAPMVALLGRTPYVVLVLTAAAVVVVAAGARFNPPMTVLTALLLSFAYQSLKICADSIVQADADDAHMGRVFALYDTGNNVFYVLGFVLGALVVPDNGYSQGSVFAVGGLFVMCAVGYGILMPRFRRSLPAV